MKTVINENTAFPRVAHAFGVYDAKKREFGVSVLSGVCTFIEKPEGEGGAWYSDKKPGEYFWANVQSTRNGAKYGAMQSSKYFRTMSEMNAWISMRITGSKKTAIKSSSGYHPQAVAK